MDLETRQEGLSHDPIRIGMIWIGLILLVAGVITASPYVRSRLAPIPVQSAEEEQSAARVDLAATVSATPEPQPSATETAAQTTAAVEPEGTPVPELSATPPPTSTPAVPSRLTIPSIDVDAPVVTAARETTEVNGQTQSTWEVPDEYAAGWHADSATLGLPGNTVLNGHNTTSGEVFRDLYQVRPGDIITLYSNGVAYIYAVSETLILLEAGQSLEVRQENAQYILPTTDERVTIVTCHPYGSLRDRLIVIVLPVDSNP